MTRFALSVFLIPALVACRPHHHTPVNYGQGAPIVSPASQTAFSVRPAAAQSAQEIVEPPRPADRVERALDAINTVLADAFFDYNRYDLRADAVEALRQNAALVRETLQTNASLLLVVEGHCDERGSAEYNIALGDQRAAQAKAFLVMLGILENRLRAVSYGEERPSCLEANEVCWQKNRRAHVTYERTQ
jgi:peptidoglycan-associated lipoprotein